MTEFLTALCSGLISGVVVAFVQTGLSKSSRFFDLLVGLSPRISETQDALLKCSWGGAIERKSFDEFHEKLMALKKDAWIVLSCDEQRELENAASIADDIWLKLVTEPSEANKLWLEHTNIRCSLDTLLGQIETRCRKQAETPIQYEIEKHYKAIIRFLHWPEKGGMRLMGKKFLSALKTSRERVRMWCSHE